MRPEAVHLKDEAERAVELLSDLCKPQPPQKPLGDLNPKAIKHCRVCSFCGNAWCPLNLYFIIPRGRALAWPDTAPELLYNLASNL